MRVIQFKIFDNHTKTMSEPIEVSELTDWNLIWYNRFNGQNEISFCDLIWMQFIGMYDKNGAEIYEGDIIQYDYWGDDGELCFSNMQIFWNEDTAQFCYDDSYLSDKTSFQELNKEFCSDVVVVGNIHQNKNLLIPTDL